MPIVSILFALFVSLSGFVNSQSTDGTTEALMTTNMNDMTTANMTTGTTNPAGKTTEPAVTTKPTPLPDIPTFIAKAEDGTTVCMIISLSAVIKFEVTENRQLLVTFKHSFKPLD